MTQVVDVGVLGATGAVGSRLLELLGSHPWFRVREVGASPGSAGRPVGELLPSAEAARLPPETASMVLREPDGEWQAPLLLSALPSDAAGELEPELARRGHLVVSNASSHRMDPQVPLVVPEVNADHLELLDAQADRWSGGLVTNPNCSVAGLVVALAPLHRAFGLERVVVTTFQAISGAGRPGPAAAALVENVLPYIAGEEEKLASEPGKILGSLSGLEVTPASFPVSATATRVPVLHGHLLAVSVELSDPVDPDEAGRALEGFRSDVAEEGLPTAPERPVEVLLEADRPQPRLDRDRGHGMTVTVGRIRRCESLHLKFLVLSHNLVRGAAGAALLNAELCRVRERIAGGALP